MRIEKSFTVDAPQNTVWQFVSSPEKVGMCFPGCQQVTAIGDDKYKASIKVQIGPIKTTFKLDFEMTENRPPEFSAYTTRGEEQNRASRLKADSTLTLSALADGRTMVAYTSDMSIVGRLGKFGLGVMSNKAEAMGSEFVQLLCAQIEGRPDSVAGTDQYRLSTLQKIIAIVASAAIILLGYYFFMR